MSMAMTTQHFKSLTPIMRNNIQQYVLFRLNRKERDKVKEELGHSMNENDFEQLLDQSTKEPYSYLFVNSMNSDRTFSTSLY